MKRLKILALLLTVITASSCKNTKNEKGREMGILKLITYLAGAAALGVSGYLVKLLNETNLMEQVAAIPSENITYFHIGAVVVIAWLIVSFVMKLISRAIIIALLVLAVGAEGTFVGMNLNGLIVEQTATLEDVKEKAEDMLEELKDAIDD